MELIYQKQQRRRLIMIIVQMYWTILSDGNDWYNSLSDTVACVTVSLVNMSQRCTLSTATFMHVMIQTQRFIYGLLENSMRIQVQC